MYEFCKELLVLKFKSNCRHLAKDGIQQMIAANIVNDKILEKHKYMNPDYLVYLFYAVYLLNNKQDILNFILRN